MLPIFYSPEQPGIVTDPILEGMRKAGRPANLDAFDVAPFVRAKMGPDVAACRDAIRPELALYIGGMGARTKNFYNDVAIKLGYEGAAKTIQDLYLDGKKAEAAAAVPDAAGGRNLAGGTGGADQGPAGGVETGEQGAPRRDDDPEGRERRGDAGGGGGGAVGLIEPPFIRLSGPPNQSAPRGRPNVRRLSSAAPSEEPPMPDAPLVRLDRDGDIGVITVNYPPVNALGPGVAEGIMDCSDAGPTPIRRSRRWC